MKLYEISESYNWQQYYLEEGCGIFAYALFKMKPGGQIVVISNPDGEKWSEEIPFETTHVGYGFNQNHCYDVKGRRTIKEMANDFGLSNYDIKIFAPDEFKREFMGNSDNFPLYGENKDIEEAMNIIKKNKTLYK